MLFDPKKFKQYVPAKESDVVEGLKRTKVLIENGWCQNIGRRYAPKVGEVVGADEVCLQTAIYDASGLDVYGGLVPDPPIRAVMHEAIDCIDIVAWNDEPGRTKQQVIDAVDKAIGIARRKNL